VFQQIKKKVIDDSRPEVLEKPTPEQIIFPENDLPKIK
jgi:hypothetical protein